MQGMPSVSTTGSRRQAKSQRASSSLVLLRMYLLRYVSMVSGVATKFAVFSTNSISTISILISFIIDRHNRPVSNSFRPQKRRPYLRPRSFEHNWCAHLLLAYEAGQIIRGQVNCRAGNGTGSHFAPLNIPHRKANHMAHPQHQIWTEAYQELSKDGVNVVGGRVSGPGVGGLTLGGGFSWYAYIYTAD